MTFQEISREQVLTEQGTMLAIERLWQAVNHLYWNSLDAEEKAQHLEECDECDNSHYPPEQ